MYWTIFVSSMMYTAVRSGNTQEGNSFNCQEPCLSLSPAVKQWISRNPELSHLWIHTALIELIGRFNWSTIIVLYSHQYEPVVYQLGDSSSFDRIQFLLFRVDSVTNNTEAVNDILADIATLVDKPRLNVLLLCDTDCVTSLLSVVNSFDKTNLRRTAYWLFSKWVTVFPHTVYKLKLHLQLNNIAFIVCPTLTECRKYKVSSRCIRAPDIVTPTLHDGDLSYTEVVYRHNATVIPNDDVFPNVKYGFNKHNLIVATHVEYPFVTKTFINGITKFDGFCLDILNALATVLNFTYTMVEPPDGEWGRFVDGRWSGLVGMCQDREVDLTIAPLTVSVDRSKVMDFAYPFYYDKLVAIYKIPDAAGSKWKTLLWPFRWEVFLSLALTCVITGTMVYCVDRKLYSKVKHRASVQQKHTVVESGLMVCAVLLRQGRMVIGAFWLFTILIAAAYCGNLVAFLTIKKDIQPLKTLADLVSQSQYTWGTIDGTLWMTLFEFSNRSDDQQMWDGLLKFNKTDPSVLAPHFPEHRLKVERGDYVFFSERSVLQMWADDNCNLVFLDDIFYKVNFAIGFPRNSPYTRLFSQIMVYFEQNGLLQLWMRTWWRGNSKCAAEDYPGARVIGLVDLQSAFFVLALGLLLGIIAILIEWRWKLKPIK